MRKVVKILGVGSARDLELLHSVQLAAREMGLGLDIEFVSDIGSFLRTGITAIPAMIIEDRIVANGRIPGISEIKGLLKESNGTEEGTQTALPVPC